MWILLLKLIIGIGSYFSDIGVDVMLGKEQFGKLITLTHHFPEDLSGLNANSTTLDRLNYLFSKDFMSYTPFPVIHLCGTWSWIFTGCFFQFVMVCFQIRHQSYLSTSWKIFIVLSSALLLGPTMIFFFCVCLILSFKLRLNSAPSTERQIVDIVDSALLFASLSKLGEIFFESIPQILTQLLMTSAYGNDGVKELSLLQMVSVATSVITIASTVSNFVIEKRGEFVSKNHSVMATRLVVIFVALSEIAFSGGIARFSFAFGQINMGTERRSLYVGIIAFMMPFILLSSIFTIIPILNNKFRTKHSEFIFIAHKILIWISIVGIFFFLGDDPERLDKKLDSKPFVERWDAKASKQNMILLKANNSFTTFIITMSFTAATNFMLVVFIMRQRADFILYGLMDSIITKTAWILKKASWIFKKVGGILTNIADAMQSGPESAEAEEEEEEEEEDKKKETEKILLTDMTAAAAKRKRKMNDASPSNATDSTKNNLDELEITPFNDAVAIEEEAEVGSPRESMEVAHTSPARPEPEDVSEPLRERRKGRKQEKFDAGKSSISEWSFQKAFCPLFIFCLLLGALAGIFLRPVNYDHGYHVEFNSNCFKDRGFPLVSATKDSKKGSICPSKHYDLNNAMVVARQLGLFSHPDAINESCSKNTTIEYKTLLFGVLEYAGEENDEGKTPLLYPRCFKGNEDNLMKCTSKGLGIVPQSCREHSRRLYIDIVRQKIKIDEWLKEKAKGPNFMYRILRGPIINGTYQLYTFSEAEHSENCNQIYEGCITGAEDTAKISYQLKTINFGKIWISDGGSFDVESGKVIEPKNVPRGEKLPFVCKVPLVGGWKQLKERDYFRAPPIYKKPSWWHQSWYHGYHVEFHDNSFKDRGFPLVSATKDSKKGSICSNTYWGLNNAMVVARQLGLFSHPDSINKLCSKNTTIEYNTLLVSDLEYAGEENEEEKTLLLATWCDTGTEDNLMKCRSFGLGAYASCHKHTRRLYINVIQQKIKIDEWLKEEAKGPNFMYRIFNKTYTFSKAENEFSCKWLYKGSITGAEDASKISYQLKTNNFGKIWISGGGIFNVESRKVIEPKNVPEEEKLPFVCKVPLVGGRTWLRFGSRTRYIAKPPPIYNKPTCGSSTKIRALTNPNSADSPS